jgi:hypothetical protein
MIIQDGLVSFTAFHAIFISLHLHLILVFPSRITYREADGGNGAPTGQIDGGVLGA